MEPKMREAGDRIAVFEAVTQNRGVFNLLDDHG